MLTSAYFELICCPACRDSLAQEATERLRCRGCAATYPIVEGVPVLLAGGEDEVSRAVSAFYSRVWDGYRERRAEGVAHDDGSPLGVRYVRRTEARFRAEVARPGGRRRFFLDAACGAFPRNPFGSRYDHHVCLDFTLEGVIAARRQIGERALPICGSLLRLPLRDGVCDATLASHCVYHIDKDLQLVALRELVRTLAPGGKLLVFYANPDNVSSRLLTRKHAWPVRVLLARARRKAPPAPLVHDQGPPVYCYLHPVWHLLAELTAAAPDARVSVRTLCLFAYAERAPLFQSRGWAAALAYACCMALERLHSRHPNVAYYLTYVVERPPLAAALPWQ